MLRRIQPRSRANDIDERFGLFYMGVPLREGLSLVFATIVPPAPGNDQREGSLTNKGTYAGSSTFRGDTDTDLNRK